MAETWMAAAGQNGIPTAFIVNKEGRIAWIGHPMGLDEALLEEIVAGRFDVAKFAAEFAREQAEKQRRMELSTRLNQAMRNKDWDAAEASLAEMEKLLPESDRDRFAPTRLRVLLGRGDHAGATKLAQTLNDTHAQDAQFLNEVAWTLVLAADLPESGLALAERIAERANDLTKAKDPSILDTLARAQFRAGKTKEAIANQELAVKLVGKGNDASLRKTLEAYKQGKLPPAN
jgi:predicted Zn-dependent protease